MIQELRKFVFLQIEVGRVSSEWRKCEQRQRNMVSNQSTMSLSGMWQEKVHGALAHEALAHLLLWTHLNHVERLYWPYLSLSSAAAASKGLVLHKLYQESAKSTPKGIRRPDGLCWDSNSVFTFRKLLAYEGWGDDSVDKVLSIKHGLRFPSTHINSQK